MLAALESKDYGAAAAAALDSEWARETPARAEWVAGQIQFAGALMARTYWDAEAVQLIAEEKVIPQWHPQLKDAKIQYVFTEEMKHRGRVILAKIKAGASAFEKYLCGASLVLMVNSVKWKTLTPEKRCALIDHEFCHVYAEPKDTGEKVYKMRGHDIEEFNAIVERHGHLETRYRSVRRAIEDSLAAARRRNSLRSISKRGERFTRYRTPPRHARVRRAAALRARGGNTKGGSVGFVRFGVRCQRAGKVRAAGGGAAAHLVGRHESAERIG